VTLEPDHSGLLETLERCYDALPRTVTRTEEIGPLVLFIAQESPWPYYARPRLGATDVTVADVAAVIARQRALDLPVALEWVHDTTPSLLAAAREAGLDVTLAPLMVLDPDTLPAPDGRARVLDPDAPGFAADLTMSRAVQHVGFGNAGTDVGSAGPAERDAAVSPMTPELVAWNAQRHRSGAAATAVASNELGMVAAGAYQRALDVVELVGIATLPAVRKQGYGGSLTAVLARHALDSGAHTVFLSAADEAVARVYARFGFRRMGTACIVG
jgi:GNAT superfamily N-acetyltransferase